MSTGKKPPERYIAYYRISKKGGTGLGIDAQREAVARTARDTPVIDEYVEEESGKSHTNRPQLAAAMDAAKKKKARLLIAKLDRLARNVHFISGLLESGADFTACDMPDANKLTIHIMAAMAEQEREATSQRTKEALQSVQRQIAKHGSHTSKRSGRTITKLGNPRWESALAKANAAKRRRLTTEAEVLDIIRTHRSAGLSLRQVAARLNELGLTTPSGAKWYASTIRTALGAE
jgi:DNA invertase Pin-like site-specific DNA recombinase